MTRIANVGPIKFPSIRRLMFVLAVLMVAPIPVVRGQNPEAQVLSGIVLDPSRAVVVGAVITIERLDAVDRRIEVATDGSGRFQVAALVSGRYRVVVLSPGFAPLVQEINVSSSEPIAEELILQPERLTETVEVAASRAPYAPSQERLATRADIPLRDLPQMVTVIPAATLADQQVTRLEDTYRNTSGINAFSGYQDFALRGFRTRDVLYNGLKANPYSFFVAPKLTNIDRVEIFKGPSSVLFGSLGPGGMVNLVTKTPEAVPSQHVSVRLGSYAQREIGLDLTGPVNQQRTVLYRLAASYEDSGHWRRFQELENAHIAPSVTWFPSTSTSLTVRTEYFRDHRDGQLDRGIIAPGGDLFAVDRTWTANEPTDFSRNTGYSADAQVLHRLPQGVNVNASFRFARSIYQEQYHEPRIQADRRTVQRQYRDDDYRINFYSGAAYVSGRAPLGGTEHQWLIGTDVGLSRETDRWAWSSLLLPPAIDALAPVYGLSRPDTFGLVYTVEGGDAQQFGLYAQDLITLAPRWKALAGVRYERYDENWIDGDDVTTEFADSAVTWRGGLVFQPVPAVSLYSSYSEGFVPIGIFSQSPAQGGPFRPETSRQVEAGAKASLFDGRLTATAAVYRIVKRNVLVTDPADSDKSVQLGKVGSDGVELDLSGSLTSRVSVVANYAWNDARVTEDTDVEFVGLTLENAPHHQASLWTRIDVLFGVGIGGGLRHVSLRSTFDPLVSLPAYTVADLGVFWRFRQFDVNARVDNLTDKEFFLGGYNQNTVFPGTPRRLHVTVGWEF